MSLDRPKTMRAWRKHLGNHTPQWDEVSVPKAPPTGFLCEVLAAGLCYSDHNLLIDKTPPRPWFQDQYILGHEACGKIVEIGSEVKDQSFKIGSIISMLWVSGCAKPDCPECIRGVPQLCQQCHHSGIGQDGFYAPYATIDERGAVLVPEGISSALAAVATAAVATSYHAVVRRAEVIAHETVFIFGLGGLGFNALQIVKGIGARVLVSDIRQERLDAAAALGIPKSDIVPISKSIQEFVQERDVLIDTTLDFVGTNQTFEDAQQILRRGGKMACVGTMSLDNVIHMKIGVRKRLSIVFSYGSQVEDLRECLDMIKRGVIDPQVEIGQLQDFPKWLQDLCDGKVKSRVALVP